MPGVLWCRRCSPNAALPSPDHARAQALQSARELWADAIRAARELGADAFVIADEQGKQLMFVPVSEALPKRIRS